MKSRLALLGSLLLFCGLGAYWYVVKPGEKSAPPPTLEAALPKEFVDAMKPGAKQEIKPSGVASEPAEGEPVFTSNGRDRMHVVVPNKSDTPLHYTMSAGDIYENGKNKVVLLENLNRDISPGLTLQTDLRVASLNLASVNTDTPWQKSRASVPHLASLMEKAQTHTDISHDAMQVAVLALTENPTIGVFAKYPRRAGSTNGAGEADFKTGTADIVAALALLSEIGVSDRLIGADPQLEIEAMIDPAAHDIAMRYYGIVPEAEWGYWKHQLLEGNPSTRHYALYGIARFYPDIALKMLPKWARETRLPTIYRLSAVRALAATNRPEAIAILHQLQDEFGANTDLYLSADNATKYLSAQLNPPPSS